MAIISQSFIKRELFASFNDIHDNKFKSFSTIQVAPPCENMLLYCEYGRVKFKCMMKFRKILTDDGLCCIFNGVHRNTLMNAAYKFATIRILIFQQLFSIK